MPRSTAEDTTDGSTGANRRPGQQTASDLAFLARAMKAPALPDAAGRLEERARKESWTHTEYLVAVLQREVSARESHGGEARVRPARFPAVKTLEELDVTHLRGLTRQEAGPAGDAAAARHDHGPADTADKPRLRPEGGGLLLGY
ncbi:ATP-binding protein [Streptomyces sp. ISL-86]|uniref:ATP-binding protein n=1 Tax=Streptomyces sp. ISL-86 TaxID=2819187 RepID=UPI0025536098|nr:ATP-binding protein [Streptomyces sp. ISL-86]